MKYRKSQKSKKKKRSKITNKIRKKIPIKNRRAPQQPEKEHILQMLMMYLNL